MMAVAPTNGVDGLSVFPITQRIAYCIRDNDQCSERMDRSTYAYDIFILLGSPPTLHDHIFSVYFSSAGSYVDACNLIDENITHVNILTRCQQR